MRFTHFRFTPYALPLTRPWHTAQGVLTARYGCLVALRTRHNEIGVGEMAPLTLPDAKTQAELLKLLDRLQQTRLWPRMKTGLSGLDEWCAEIGISAEKFPDLMFAVQCALGSLVARRARKPLHVLLSSSAPASVPVNAVIADEERTEILAATEQAVAEGFRTLKLKIGIRPVAEDIELLKELRAKYPNLTLRLDANGAWTFRQALRFCRDAYKLNIEYVEDPLREPTIPSFNALPGREHVPVALDNSPLKPTDLAPVRRGCRDFVFIVKPSRHATFTALRHFAAWAGQRGASIVFTGSLESSIGLSYVAACAGAFGSPKHAHGLATAAWLAEDTVNAPLLPQHGEMILPNVCDLHGYLVPRYQDELGIAT